MAQFYTDQINFQRGNPALGGLAGSPNFIRNTEAGGGEQIWRFSYTVPASGGPAINDVLDLAYLEPTARMYGIFFANAATWGAGATLSIGRVDPNNPANNSANRWVSAADMTVVATTVVNRMLLAGEQVGTDNRGDLSTGNIPPQFGAARIIVQATFLGAVPTAGSVLQGWLVYVEGNQA
jgi:hypothetical protein